MNVITIAETKGRIGSFIPGVTGIVTKIFPQKTGETVKAGKKFPWSLQTIELSDDTGLTKVTVFGAKDSMPESWKGQEISIISTQGKQGLEGVLVELNKYTNKSGQEVSNVQLKVDTNAKILLGTAKDHFEPKPEVEALKNALQGRTNEDKPQPATSVFPTHKDAPQVNVDEMVGKYGALYKVCLVEAKKVGEGMECEVTKDIASCFFIQGVRDGLLNHIQVNVEEAF